MPLKWLDDERSAVWRCRRSPSWPPPNRPPSNEGLAYPNPFSSSPADVGSLLALTSSLASLEASPLALAELTDQILEHPAAEDSEPLDRLADLRGGSGDHSCSPTCSKAPRAAYVETVKFLNIPRTELPNRQDVPLRDFDPDPRLDTAASEEPLVDGLNSDGLVPDTVLAPKPMGENALEAVLLDVTRGIYSEETGVPRVEQKGINGLLEEMRRFMLSDKGYKPEDQQEVLIKTLRTLMTPFLPPFYRIFMGGIVPSYDPDDDRVGADPKWLADGVQAVRAKLPEPLQKYLEPGKQYGPWFYAPLTAVVAHLPLASCRPVYAQFEIHGRLGLVVEKCVLQESNCKGMCLNSCKLPAQNLFNELGLPCKPPNFATHECQWSFGEPAPLSRRTRRGQRDACKDALTRGDEGASGGGPTVRVRVRCETRMIAHVLLGWFRLRRTGRDGRFERFACCALCGRVAPSERCRGRSVRCW